MTPEKREQIIARLTSRPDCNLDGENGCANITGWSINGRLVCTNHVAVVWLDHVDSEQFREDVQRFDELIAGDSTAGVAPLWAMLRKFIGKEILEQRDGPVKLKRCRLENETIN